MIIDYVVETIRSAAFMLASCEDAAQADAISGRALCMLTNAWSTEFKRYVLVDARHDPERINLLISAFWHQVHITVVSQLMVHDFQATWGETVNPPGQHGIVRLNVQPTNSVTWVTFMIVPQA